MAAEYFWLVEYSDIIGYFAPGFIIAIAHSLHQY